MKMRLAMGAAVLISLIVAGCSQQFSGRGSTGSATEDAVRTTSFVVGPADTETASTTDAATTEENITHSAIDSDAASTSYTTITTTEVSDASLAIVIGSSSMTPNESGAINFQSPSGNIMCVVYDDSKEFGEARCDIITKTYADPPPRTDCGATGFSTKTAVIELAGNGKVGACVGDTVVNPDNPKLEYGSSASSGRFGCKSAETGVTCQNLLNGHGFTISKATYYEF